MHNSIHSFLLYIILFESLLPCQSLAHSHDREPLTHADPDPVGHPHTGHHVHDGHHDHHENCSGHCMDGHVNPQLSDEPEDLRRLGHLVHSAITGEHAHFVNWRQFLSSLSEAGTWRLWWNSIQNLPYALTNYRRAINGELAGRESSKDFSRHAKNIFLLYASGELFELFVVPALGGSFTFGSDAPGIVKTVVGTFSALTPLPGIEPACFALMACYGVSGRFRNAVDRVVRGSSRFVFSYFSERGRDEVPTVKLAESIFSNLKGRTEAIVSTELTDESYKLEVKIGDRTVLAMDFVLDGSENSMGWKIEGYLVRIEIDKEALSAPNERLGILNLASVFGSNVGQAVSEVVRFLKRQKTDTLSRRFYVSHLGERGNSLEIEYKPHMVFFSPLSAKKTERFIDLKLNVCEKALLP